MSEHRYYERLPVALQRVLKQLRRRIRLYVAVEGLAIAIIWLTLTFWAGLALDYFPVLMGASEMPVAARAVLLSIIGVVLAYILYRWVLRRTWARLRASSLALLLEKRFPKINDALVTAVELSARDDHSPLERKLLDDATQTAIQRVQSIRVGQVLNVRPLYGKLLAAGLLAATVVGFGMFAQQAFAVWSQRLYGLSERPWPRRTYLEVLGFDNGLVKVAKGGNVSVRVRADADRPSPPPEVCSIHYHTADGERGRVNMNRAGEVRDGYQYYVFDGKPFQGILSDITFDVVGNDYRVRDLQVNMVPSPQILSVDLDCTLPPYTGLLPRQVKYRSGLQLAQGTHVVATLRANKPLTRVEVWNKSDDSRLEIPVAGEGDQRSFVYVLDALHETTELEFVLHDHDGVSSQEPYRMLLVALADTPPQIDIRLAGIGAAITPDAMLPITGEVTDDYGLERVWFSLEVTEAAAREIPIELPGSSELKATLDLREQTASEEHPLQLQAGANVVLSVRAQDKYNLEGVPHTAEGDRYELQVVSPTELVALLEARELALRQRFEQIIKEMRESRDSLSRVQYDEDSQEGELADTRDLSSGAEPDDPRDADEDPDRARQRAASLRLLRVQRANQHSERAAQEVLGVALSFEDIRLELINNRIDSEERQSRIVHEIASPLRQIAESMLPALTSDLEELEGALNASPEVSMLADEAVAQADAVLLAMEQVLEKMLDLESYNQLLELVRSLVEQQESLIERTKEERKKQALELLQ